MYKNFLLLIFVLLQLDSYAQSANEYFNKGNIAYQVQNRKLAIQNLNEAIRLNPTFEKALFLRGKAHLELDDYNKALDDFNQVAELDQQEPEYFYYKGRAEWHLGRLKVASLDLEKTLEYKPTHFEAMLLLGDIYLELKLYENAKVYFDKVLKLKPDFVGTSFKRVEAYRNKENYIEAMQEFNKEILKNSNSGEAYFNRGIHKEIVYDYEGAFADYTNSLLSDTTMIIANFYLANIKNTKKDYKSAQQYLSKYLQKYPYDSEANKMRDMLKSKLGKE